MKKRSVSILGEGSPGLLRGRFRGSFPFLGLALALLVWAIAFGPQDTATAEAPEPFGAAADSGSPATITASYSGGALTVSGTYSWPGCSSSSKGAGFAVFINGANPVSPGSGALDGTDVANTMHPANMSSYVFPCTSSGSWGPDSHALASAPSQVCVVIYDVHSDKLAPKTGNHSTVGAGASSKRNTDNSYEENDDSYGAGACTAVSATPSPTPTPVPSPSPSPTPSGNHSACNGADVKSYEGSGDDDGDDGGHPSSGQNADDDDDDNDIVTYTASPGRIVTGVCIKSGSNMFPGGAPTGHGGLVGNGTYENGCYQVTGAGTQTVTVRRVGNPSSSCQGISHIDIFTAPTPTPTPAPTPTPTPPPLVIVPEVEINGAQPSGGTGGVESTVKDTGGSVPIDLGPVKCADNSIPTSVSVRITDYNGAVYVLALTLDSQGRWVGAWSAPPGPAGSKMTVDVVAVCPEGQREQAIGEIVRYDPSGVIRDLVASCTVMGAQVVLQRSTGGQTGPFIFQNPNEQIGGVFLIDPQINPQFSNADGSYGWDVAAGWWRVVVSHPNYQTVISQAVQIPPPVTDLHVDLTPNGQPGAGCLGFGAATPGPSPTPFGGKTPTPSPKPSATPGKTPSPTPASSGTPAPSPGSPAPATPPPSTPPPAPIPPQALPQNCVSINGGPETSINGQVRAGVKYTGGLVPIEVCFVGCPSGAQPIAVNIIITDFNGTVYRVPLALTTSSKWAGEWNAPPGPRDSELRVEMEAISPLGIPCFKKTVGVIERYDPSGRISDAISGCSVLGARVVLQRKAGEQWLLANPTDLQQGTVIMDPPVNPQFTDADGSYGWDVVEGWWRVEVSHPDYKTQVSREVYVPPQVTDLHLALEPASPDKANRGCLSEQQIETTPTPVPSPAPDGQTPVGLPQSGTGLAGQGVDWSSWPLYLAAVAGAVLTLSLGAYANQMARAFAAPAGLVSSRYGGTRRTLYGWVTMALLLAVSLLLTRGSSHKNGRR